MPAGKNDGRSVSAQSPPSRDPAVVRFDRFELDESNALLMREGKPVALAPTPFAVLCALVRRPGTLLTKHALLDEVWGHRFVSDSVLKSVISELRTVFDDDARNPRFIETVSRRGYRFIAPSQAAAPTTTVNASAPASPALSFIGRNQALSQLGAAWNLACGGKRQIVWVAGEPGVGKTTLIEHFISGLNQVACVRGQCVEQYGGGEPYLPVLEALAELCRHDSTVKPLLRAIAPTWLLQLPWLSSADERDSLQRELAGVGADRALREIGELLDRYTERQPLLLVTEDLHWSDRATIQLIDYMARRRGTARLMWVGSFRLTEVVALDHPLSPLRRELRLHGLCQEIVLNAFSEMEVAEYVAQHSVEKAADEAFVQALHERTDGLPLFVASVMSEMNVRAAQGDGRIAPAQVAKMAVPENLAAIIESYIARLGDEQRRLLSAAAVCGVQFRIDTLASVLESDAASLDEACDELAREGLWLTAEGPGGTSHGPERLYSFRHALFRQVLYEHTASVTLMQLHRKVGVALERERRAGTLVAAAELAMHFERAGEASAAVRFYAEAAEAALARFSPEECMRIIERLSPLLEKKQKGEERSTLEVAVATLRGLAATRMLGAGSEAKSAFQDAYSLLDSVPQHAMRGRLLHGFGFLLCLRAEYAEALAVADRAQALGQITNDPVLLSTACTIHGEVDQLQGRWRTARTWLERGLALAEGLEVGPGEYLVDPQVALLGLLSIPLLHLGLVEDARACLKRAYARAQERGWPMARLVALWHNALFQVRLGNAEVVVTLVDEMAALVDEFALALGRNGYRWFRGWANARLGQPRQGHRLIREAHEDDARLGMLVGATETLGYATEALLLAGDLDGAQKELEEALRLVDKLGERVYLPNLHLMAAAIARARGEAALAEASVRRSLAEAKAQEAPWLELAALVELHDSDYAKAADRRALRALVDALPQAAGTTVFERARRALG